MVSHRHHSEPEFLASVRQYWSNYAVAREVDGDSKPGCLVTPGSLRENGFYRFDAESMSALRHAVEDLALEEAQGNLLSAFQCGPSFEAHRERYIHLAATVDRVEIIICGALPRRIPHARLIRDTKGICRDYSLVLYEGKRSQALFACRQVNQSPAFDDRQFEGFYSFNPQLITRVRDDMRKLASGRLSFLREFHRLFLIDQMSKQIKTEFAREEEALDMAMQRLLLDSDRYHAAHFASDLERGLSRLNQWKNRLPKILARAAQ